jgi:hypothetical protein
MRRKVFSRDERIEARRHLVVREKRRATLMRRLLAS